MVHRHPRTTPASRGGLWIGYRLGNNDRRIHRVYARTGPHEIVMACTRAFVTAHRAAWAMKLAFPIEAIAVVTFVACVDQTRVSTSNYAIAGTFAAAAGAVQVAEMANRGGSATSCSAATCSGCCDLTDHVCAVWRTTHVGRAVRHASAVSRAAEALVPTASARRAGEVHRRASQVRLSRYPARTRAASLRRLRLSHYANRWSSYASLQRIRCVISTRRAVGDAPAYPMSGSIGRFPTSERATNSFPFTLVLPAPWRSLFLARKRFGSVWRLCLTECRSGRDERCRCRPRLTSPYQCSLFACMCHLRWHDRRIRRHQSQPKCELTHHARRRNASESQLVHSPSSRTLLDARAPSVATTRGTWVNRGGRKPSERASQICRGVDPGGPFPGRRP